MKFYVSIAFREPKEAIEIAKKYSTPDAAVFINGVLDRVKRMVYPVGR